MNKSILAVVALMMFAASSQAHAFGSDLTHVCRAGGGGGGSNAVNCGPARYNKPKTPKPIPPVPALQPDDGLFRTGSYVFNDTATHAVVVPVGFSRVKIVGCGAGGGTSTSTALVGWGQAGGGGAGGCAAVNLDVFEGDTIYLTAGTEGNSRIVHGTTYEGLGGGASYFTLANDPNNTKYIVGAGGGGGAAAPYDPVTYYGNGNAGHGGAGEVGGKGVIPTWQWGEGVDGMGYAVGLVRHPDSELVSSGDNGDGYVGGFGNAFVGAVPDNSAICAGGNGAYAVPKGGGSSFIAAENGCIMMIW